MNEPALKYNNISPDEYLAVERAALEKHEYYQGEVFAVSGASLQHNVIFSNLFTDIGNKLKGKSCKPYGSDLRIHIPKNTLYTYPDISIICSEVHLTEMNLTLPPIQQLSLSYCPNQPVITTRAKSLLCTGILIRLMNTYWWIRKNFM